MANDTLSPKQISELRVMLEAQQLALQTLLQSNDRTTKPVELDQQSVGRVSRVDAIQQQQMAIASQDQAVQVLGRVRLALARIANGEYGYCQHCAETIPLARLQAQPFASLCVDCQAATEN